VRRDGSDKIETVTASEGRAQFTPRLPGFYRIGAGSGTAVAAVSLFNKDESDLTKAVGDPFPEIGAGEGASRTDRLAPYFIMAVMLLLIVDWVVFHAGRLP